MPSDASNASCCQVKPAKADSFLSPNISMRSTWEQSQCHGEGVSRAKGLAQVVGRKVEWNAGFGQQHLMIGPFIFG
jgi:hypothetical protein